MPSVNPTANDYFLNKLKTLEAQVRALSTQQNFGITDQHGDLRVRGGLQPDGAYGIWILNGTGAPLLKIETGNFTALDPFGNVRAEMGLLSDGFYGFAVSEPGTPLFHISPPAESFVATVLSTTSTSFVTLGGPSVTVTVGSSGRALVMPSSTIGITGGASSTAWQAKAAVKIPGVGTQPLVSASAASVSGHVTGLQVTSSNSYLWTTIPEGTREFTMVFKSEYGQTCKFSDNSLVVIPY